MNTTEIAIRETPSAVILSETQLNFIAKTEFVPASLRGNLPAIMACVATGRALGVPDMTALRSIHIIDGKATFSAELMVQLVRAHGHSMTAKYGEGAVTVTGRRRDNGDEMEVTWTLEMAKRAGIANKQNWQRYPEAMLWARAASQLCRMLFADCFAGSTYTPEEVDDAEIIAFADDIQDSEPEPQATEPVAAHGDPADSTTLGAPVPAPSGSEHLATEPQKKKLNVLVGTLRDAGHITTTQLYIAVGRDAYPWLADDAEPRWSPLRDSLTRDEASELIERLDRYAEERAA